MPTFDPAQFVDMETTQESVKRPPLTEADYPAMIGEVKAVGWSKDDKSGVRLTVPLKISVPPEEKARMGIDADEITLTDSVMLDTLEGGGIDYSPGKNSKLRKYREATGLNKAGEAFSPRRLQGQPVLVKIKHELYEGEVQEKIAAVAKMG